MFCETKSWWRELANIFVLEHFRDGIIWELLGIVRKFCYFSSLIWGLNESVVTFISNEDWCEKSVTFLFWGSCKSFVDFIQQLGVVKKELSLFFLVGICTEKIFMAFYKSVVTFSVLGFVRKFCQNYFRVKLNSYFTSLTLELEPITSTILSPTLSLSSVSKDLKNQLRD